MIIRPTHRFVQITSNSMYILLDFFSVSKINQFHQPSFFLKYTTFTSSFSSDKFSRLSGVKKMYWNFLVSWKRKKILILEKCKAYSINTNSVSRRNSYFTTYLGVIDYLIQSNSSVEAIHEHIEFIQNSKRGLDLTPKGQD